MKTLRKEASEEPVRATPSPQTSSLQNWENVSVVLVPPPPALANLRPDNIRYWKPFQVHWAEREQIELFFSDDGYDLVGILKGWVWLLYWRQSLGSKEKTRGQLGVMAEICSTVRGDKKREVLGCTFKLKPKTLYDYLLGNVMWEWKVKKPRASHSFSQGQLEEVSCLSLTKMGKAED